MRGSFVLLVCVAFIAAAATEALAQPLCTGDCDGDAEVTVAELLRGVNASLGTPGLGCSAFDVNLDQRVSIDELLAAVNAALFGCVPRPTPTRGATRTATQTSTPTITPTRTPVPLVVTTLEDGPPGSLRERLAVATAGDTIIINVAGVIRLTAGPLVIDKALTVAGPGADVLTISGDNRSRVLEVVDASATVSGVTIADGRFEGDGGDGPFAGGGGIFNHGALVLRDCIVTRNRAVSPPSCPVCGGGGIFWGRLTLERTTVTDNEAVNGFGGGIYTVVSPLIRDSTISGNRASSGGGGIIHRDSTALRIINTTISGNTTEGLGGGIHMFGPVVLANVTIANNSASSGGGIAVDCARGLLGCGPPRLSVGNSIVADNTGGASCWRDPRAPQVNSSGGNVGDDGTCGFTQPTDRRDVANARLDPLSDNGGPTLTHALRPRSPAVDAGPIGGCPDLEDGLLSTDQRGLPRRSGRACDSGAFELQQSGQ